MLTHFGAQIVPDFARAAPQAGSHILVYALHYLQHFLVFWHKEKLQGIPPLDPGKPWASASGGHVLEHCPSGTFLSSSAPGTCQGQQYLLGAALSISSL